MWTYNTWLPNLRGTGAEKGVQNHKYLWYEAMEGYKSNEKKLNSEMNMEEI